MARVASTGYVLDSLKVTHVILSLSELNPLISSSRNSATKKVPLRSVYSEYPIPLLSDNNERNTAISSPDLSCDLPDEEDKKSPVLLLGVNKISDSPSFSRRRSIDHPTGSIRFFRPPKSKYTRGLHGDERLEKIRQDLLIHKQKPDSYIPNHKKNNHETSDEIEERCLKFNCASNCMCEKKNSSKRGSFSFHASQRQSSLCPSEPYQKKETKDLSENDIEFKYTQLEQDCQPSSSKQHSYNVTPKSVDRRHFLLSNLNERFRKTLSLDSRKIDTGRIPLSLPKETRPKSLVNTSNIIIKEDNSFLNQNFDKVSQPKKKRKSFFSLDTFFDSKKSDTSSTDDYCSSKYKRFELESDDSPLFRRDNRSQREKTPDLLNLPVIIDSVRKKQSDTRRQLEKLESHYNKTIKNVIDAVPKDAKVTTHTNRVFTDDDDVEYIEPIGSHNSAFTSQSTLILEKHIPEKPDSILTIFTDETDIRLPSSTISPKSDLRVRENDLDSIGAYEIEVKESDLLKGAKDLTVKVMDKSVDSIGSCSLDVDASTDFSDTTSGSLNLLTPSSTASRVKDFTNRLQERAAPFTPAPPPQVHIPKPVTPPDDYTPFVRKERAPHQDNIHRRIDKEERKSNNLLRPPSKQQAESVNRRNRNQEINTAPYKPSYLQLACSVNGYTPLTAYSRSREPSPVRPHLRENSCLLVPVPIGTKLLIGRSPGNERVETAVRARTEPSLTMADQRSHFLNTDQPDNAQFKSSFSENNFKKTVGTVTSIPSCHQKHTQTDNYTITTNGVKREVSKENGENLASPMKSFIQQRVERLYGPGALAQGFLMQRNRKSFDDVNKVLTEKSLNGQNERSKEVISPNGESEDVSLPVLRHLRPEFRAQLPILSPKKHKNDISPQKDIPVKTESEKIVSNGVSVVKSVDEVSNGVSVLKVKNESEVKDGHYFLELENRETERLHALAAAAEKELDALQDAGAQGVEEAKGMLRAAAGKARLLATQKMQQFRGLCYANIEPSGSNFPTTVEDLQGFWDMVQLQVANVDALHEHIAVLKKNNWREMSPSPVVSVRANSNSRRKSGPAQSPAQNEKARLAAEKREADRKAMLEQRRRMAREKMLAARTSADLAGCSHSERRAMQVEGSQEVEIFVGKSNKPPSEAPQGDVASQDPSTPLS